LTSRLDGMRSAFTAGCAGRRVWNKTDALFSPLPVKARFQLAPDVFVAVGQACFPGSLNTVKPLASPNLRHAPLCDAPSFETGSLAPKTAAKLMHPALDPQHDRRPDRIHTNAPSPSGLTCLVSRFFQTFWNPTPRTTMKAINIGTAKMSV
jgi:hypothetical protein